MIERAVQPQDWLAIHLERIAATVIAEHPNGRAMGEHPSVVRLSVALGRVFACSSLSEERARFLIRSILEG